MTLPPAKTPLGVLDTANGSAVCRLFGGKLTVRQAANAIVK
jgi:hypothetical protein